MFGEGSAMDPDGFPLPGGPEPVWQRLARVRGSAGYVTLAGTAGGGAAGGAVAATPRWEEGQPSVERLVAWSRRAGFPAEFVDRMARTSRPHGWPARIARAHGWEDVP